ncbi:hypothetical protein ccbrp13_28090 [Ktedonobacteria bacterium brp13]|nr:hypothetical protein ccbrp13_28090 [Ktedonobacteria bacterium brp13]
MSPLYKVEHSLPKLASRVNRIPINISTDYLCRATLYKQEDGQWRINLRLVLRKSFPRSGTPDVFQDYAHFDRFVQDLIATGCIDNGKKIWWDMRPHPFFDTE